MQKTSLPTRIASTTLTLGASLVLGLLSFAGFYTIIPLLPFAIASFVLATVYEGEIYNQNITHAIQKLFDNNYFKSQRALTLLDKLILENGNELKQKHSFFNEYIELQDYIQALQLRKKLDKSQKEALKKALKRQSLMQDYFKKLLFKEIPCDDAYAKGLHDFLDTQKGEDHPDAIIKETESKLRFMRFGKWLSLAAGLFVGVGTAALLIETFTTISFLALSAAAMPYAVIPLAALAAAGYFYLTYNSITDMVWNETIQKWWQEVKTDMKTSGRTKAITLAIVSALLIAMSVSLALCTAGTWWTVVKSNPKLLSFLTRVPHIITAVLVTVFGGIAQLIFGIENIKETLDNVKALFTGIKLKNIGERLMGPFKRLYNNIAYAWEHESKAQFFNPFRFLINFVETPLRVLGFMGHIGSIGVTADRVPGLKPALTIGLNMAEEVAEDAHYFMPKGDHHHDEAGHKHHGHNHGDSDLPSRMIKFALFPLYGLSILWHKVTSHFVDNTPVSWKEAYRQQYGIPPEKEDDDSPLPDCPEFANDFQKAATLMELKEKEQTYTSSDNQKQKKATAFHRLYEKVEKIEPGQLNQASFQALYRGSNDAQDWRTISPQGEVFTALNKHRLPLHHGKPRSAQSIDGLQAELKASPTA